MAVLDGVFVAVLVMRGVFVAGRVAVGSGVIVAVYVAVGASPSKVNVPEAFHSVPAKMRTSYMPGSHLSAGCCHTVFPTPNSISSHALVSKFCSSPSRYQMAVHCTSGCIPM